jgi:hypothetical protein
LACCRQFGVIRSGIFAADFGDSFRALLLIS